MLFVEGSVPLPWSIRMKIALGAAKGLAFLHEEVQRPIIYRDFKTSNILLDAVSDYYDWKKFLFFFFFLNPNLKSVIICRITMLNCRILDWLRMVRREIRHMSQQEFWEPMVMQHQNMWWPVSFAAIFFLTAISSQCDKIFKIFFLAFFFSVVVKKSEWLDALLRTSLLRINLYFRSNYLGCRIWKLTFCH